MTRVAVEDSYGATELGYSIHIGGVCNTFLDTDLSDSVTENWQCYKVDVHEINDDADDANDIRAEARVGSPDAKDDTLILAIQNEVTITAASYSILNIIKNMMIIFVYMVGRQHAI